MMKYSLKILTLGSLLATLFWITKGPPQQRNERPEILVSEADIAHQSARWEKMRGRPPTPQELKDAVNSYIHNEVLYQEAISRGMDREDPRVRMALIQKMQMMSAGQADAQSLTEEDLTSFYALRKEQYRVPAKCSLQQVFFKDRNGATEQAQQLLEAFLENEPSEAMLFESGDSSMLETVHTAMTAEALEKTFGTAFTAEILSLPPDKWAGPIRSSYGLHLVKMYDRIQGRIPAFSEVRAKVERDLLYEARTAAEEQGYQEIAGKYQVAYTPAARALMQGDAE